MKKAIFVLFVSASLFACTETTTKTVINDSTTAGQDSIKVVKDTTKVADTTKNRK